jgi:hypothetical protein
MPFWNPKLESSLPAPFVDWLELSDSTSKALIERFDEDQSSLPVHCMQPVTKQISKSFMQEQTSVNRMKIGSTSRDVAALHLC